MAFLLNVMLLLQALLIQLDNSKSFLSSENGIALFEQSRFRLNETNKIISHLLQFL